MVALRAQGRPLRAIAETIQASGYRISHEGVAGVLRASGIAGCAKRPRHAIQGRTACRE
jgi:hypothetical protein